MNDEEKKAIEELKKVRWNSLAIVVKNEDGKMDISYFTEKHKKTILNLIEKQSKEIEELIQRNKDLEEIEKEHKKENGRLREELSQYKRIDKLVSNITPEEVDTAIKRASEQFIEVSKVEKELIQLNKDEKTELKGIKGQDRYFVKQQYAAKREILEKVLKMKGR